MLFRLQQIDNKIKTTRSHLVEIEAALKDNSKLSVAQEQADSSSQTLQEARKALQSAERNVQDQRIKIQHSETVLYSGKVRNPKELQDIQTEAVSLKKYLNVLEDRQLEAMIAVEEAEIKFNEAATNLKSIETETAIKVSSLEEDRTKLLRDLDLYESERQVAVGGIASEDIEVYEMLRNKRSGVAVAKVSDKNCMACGSTLTPALIQSAQSPIKLTHCASCGRILYIG